MKKVLLIAHHFPPMGGPGINRSLQLTRYLHEMGYEIHILTVTVQDIEEGTYPSDPTLLENLPHGIKIHRVPLRRPKRFREAMIKVKVFRLFWYLMYPLFWEPAARWPGACLPVAKKIIKDENIPLIYTSSGPFAAARLGYLLRKSSPVKWVCDLRDPFTDAYFFSWPSKLHWKWCRRQERKWYNRADKLVVNTPAVERLYLKRNLVPAERMTVITNGYGDA